MTTREKPTAALILNPAAGRGDEEDLERLREALGARFAVDVHTTSAERDADACAREALAAEPQVVVVAGGDGTVSMVAGALVGTNASLGIIPRGTSNSIAAALGIPADEAGAVETILGGEARIFDSARANGRPMLLHACVGLHAAAVGDTPRDAKNRWGVLAYVMEAISKLTNLEPFQVKIRTENEVVVGRAINVMVANAAPTKTVLAQGPAQIVPDDGALDVTLVAASGLAEAVATGVHLLRSAASQEAATRDNVGFLTAKRVRIDTDPAQPLLIDGEPAGEGRLEVECLPRSIRILVPPAAAERPPPSPSAELADDMPDPDVAEKLT